MIKKRVAISGKMASGKTTCSNYLIQRYGYQRVSFGMPVKEIVSWYKDYLLLPDTEKDEKLKMENALFHRLVEISLGNYTKANRCFEFLLKKVFPEYKDMDWSVEKDDRSRKLLQDVGDGMRVEVDCNIWVDYLISTLQEDGLYICDDLRYPNEYQALVELGFTVIRLHMDSKAHVERVKRLYGEIDKERLNHVSEILLDDMDFKHVIDSSQELSKVLYQVAEIAEAKAPA